MKDQELPRQPDGCSPEEQERSEREKVEDERRYQHYLKTGECISHEQMMAWFDELERAAASNTFASSR